MSLPSAFFVVEDDVTTNQSWKVMLIAAGPGALACAALGVVEFSTRRSLMIDLIGAYPVALMAFLPGIPLLGYTLVRAFPAASPQATGRVRPGWLAISWVAPWWHVGATQLLLRAAPLDWHLVARHSVCLWIVTACGWFCVSSRPTAIKRDPFAMRVELRPTAPALAPKAGSTDRFDIDNS